MRRTINNKSTTKNLISDSESSFESDFSTNSNISNVSTASPRRNRKNWSEAEEACLISGVGKVKQHKVCVLRIKILIM